MTQPLVYTPSSALADRVDRDFTYQRPDAEQVERMAHIRSKCHDLAKDILTMTPASREQSLALTDLEQVSMWCNAAIARNESAAT